MKNHEIMTIFLNKPSDALKSQKHEPSKSRTQSVFIDHDEQKTPNPPHRKTTCRKNLDAFHDIFELQSRRNGAATKYNSYRADRSESAEPYR